MGRQGNALKEYKIQCKYCFRFFPSHMLHFKKPACFLPQKDLYISELSEALININNSLSMMTSYLVLELCISSA